MNQVWILVILVFCQKMTSGAGEEKTVKEGQPVDMTCRKIEKATLVVWFRVLDTGVEFIGSFSNTGFPRSSAASLQSTFIMNNEILRLKSFNKTRDSGVYSCASLMNGVALQFGKVFRLVGEPVEVRDAPQTTITAPNQRTTAATCVCNNTENKEQGEASPRMFCSLIILGPLAGGCGLLVLLLIFTILFCNKLRTRRCPHHYKRKPQVMAPGKQMRTNRHV